MDIGNIIGTMRWILLYRSRTVKRVMTDFGNELFQKFRQTKQYASFLEHLKNVSHSASHEAQAISVLTTILKNSQGKKMSEQEEYYIAACYKLLSDINISTLYHNIITKKMPNYKIDDEKLLTHIIFQNTGILKKCKGKIMKLITVLPRSSCQTY